MDALFLAVRSDQQGDARGVGQPVSACVGEPIRATVVQCASTRRCWALNGQVPAAVPRVAPADQEVLGVGNHELEPRVGSDEQASLGEQACRRVWVTLLGGLQSGRLFTGRERYDAEHLL